MGKGRHPGPAWAPPVPPHCLSDRLHSFQIYSWIDNFVAEHSDIVSRIRIGHSFENRSIVVLKVKAGSGDHWTQQ